MMNIDLTESDPDIRHWITDESDPNGDPPVQDPDGGIFIPQLFLYLKLKAVDGKVFSTGSNEIVPDPIQIDSAYQYWNNTKVARYQRISDLYNPDDGTNMMKYTISVNLQSWFGLSNDDCAKVGSFSYIIGVVIEQPNESITDPITNLNLPSGDFKAPLLYRTKEQKIELNPDYFYRLKSEGGVGINTSEPHEMALLQIDAKGDHKALLLPLISDNTRNHNRKENTLTDVDNEFRGAIIYDKRTGMVQEHDGENWISSQTKVKEMRAGNIAYYRLADDTYSDYTWRDFFDDLPSLAYECRDCEVGGVTIPCTISEPTQAWIDWEAERTAWYNKQYALWEVEHAAWDEDYILWEADSVAWEIEHAYWQDISYAQWLLDQAQWLLDDAVWQTDHTKWETIDYPAWVAAVTIWDNDPRPEGGLLGKGPRPEEPAEPVEPPKPVEPVEPPKPVKPVEPVAPNINDFPGDPLLGIPAEEPEWVITDNPAAAACRRIVVETPRSSNKSKHAGWSAVYKEGAMQTHVTESTESEVVDGENIEYTIITFNTDGVYRVSYKIVARVDEGLIYPQNAPPEFGVKLEESPAGNAWQEVHKEILSRVDGGLITGFFNNTQADILHKGFSGSYTQYFKAGDRIRVQLYCNSPVVTLNTADSDLNLHPEAIFDLGGVTFLKGIPDTGYSDLTIEKIN
jgi:hypothetical protein